MKKLLLFFVLIAFVFSCSHSRVYKIGISQCSQDDWRTKMNEEIQREMILHDDAEVEIRSADDSSEKQIKDIEYFVDNNFDIIIVAPNEAEGLTPIVKKVYQSGRPIVVFDRNINGDTYTARIGADDNGLGRAAAHYAFSITKNRPNAIEIYGLRGSTPAEERHNGFVEEFTKGGGKLLASVSANWNKEDAIPIVDSLLNIYKDIDLIYAHNDRMAIGAAEVAKGRGYDGIKIIGIDAAPNIGIKAVADGVIDATFLYPTDGQLIIQTALAILKGEPYQKENIIPVSSAVDRSNADILLLQNDALKGETEKLNYLKEQVDKYLSRYSSQKLLLYLSIVIILLFSVVLFLLLRTFWQHKRHQRILMERNELLKQQRDMQKSLNEKLNEVTQSKLSFFTNVSHDLRTPLTLITEPVTQLCNAKNLTEQQHSLITLADKYNTPQN